VEAGVAMNEKDSKAETQLVIFRLQQEEFGIEIKNVREIVPMVNITHLPSASEHMMVGVINLRGQVIPVIDLSKLLELPSLSMLPKTARIVVVEVDDMVVGMIVEEVPEVLKIAQEDIESTPGIIQQKINMDFIEGIGKLGDRIIIILDLAKLIQPHENTLQLKKETNDG
jgi:purine-binding chemotaxis protein CheW